MATNPTLLAMPIAKNGTKNTIPATQATAGDGLLSQSTGFPPETALPLGAGGKAPTREDFNGAFNLLSDIAFYSQKGWTFQYDANQAYYKGCIVMDATDGLRYECINDVAAGTILPSADQDNDYWREYSPGGVPLGTIIPYAANAAEPPYSFLFCEGQAISRTMYPDLFDLIGTTYGSGDGSTTFNLPNMLDRYPQGSTTAGTVKAAGLPNITGTVKSQAVSGGATEPQVNPDNIGAITTNVDASLHSNVSRNSSYTGNYLMSVGLDASLSNPIYGNSDTVTPPTITMRAIIKAYDAPTPSSAQIDLSQYASDLAARLTREQTPAFNKRDIVTTSGTYTAPVTGWYRIVVKGGGGGGQGGGYTSSGSTSGHGGGEGGMSRGYEKMLAGETATVVIGAGGSGGAKSTSGAGSNGTNGGDSSVTVNNTTYTGYGGYANGFGGNGDIIGAPGGIGMNLSGNLSATGGNGGGNGGGRISANGSAASVGYKGGGGAGGGANTNTSSSYAGGAGGDGYAEFSYFDPTLM